MKIPVPAELLQKVVRRIFDVLDFVIQDYQEEIIMYGGVRLIILKACGIGVTLAISLKILLLALYIRCEYILVSKDKDAALHVLTYIQMFYDAIIHTPLATDETNGFKARMVGRGAKNEKWFSNGSMIKSFASEPKGIRSFHGFIYWDESAYHDDSREMYKSIKSRLKPVNYPLYISSSPNEMSGEFYTIWKEEKGWDKKELNYKRCKIASYIKDVEKEKEDALARGILDDWLNEYMCKFIDGNTRLFPWTLIIEHLEKSAPKNVDIQYIGIDFGKQVDKSEVVGIGKDKEKRIRVPKMFDFPLRQNYDIQLVGMGDFIKEVHKSLGRVYVDRTGVGNKLFEDMKNESYGDLVEGITYTNAIKERMIMFLYSALCSDRILLPNDNKLKEQLHSIRRSTSEIGTVRYAHETGKHDDRVWALAQAMQGYANDTIEQEGQVETVNKQSIPITATKLTELKRQTEGLI